MSFAWASHVKNFKPLSMIKESPSGLNRLIVYFQTELLWSGPVIWGSASDSEGPAYYNFTQKSPRKFIGCFLSQGLCRSNFFYEKWRFPRFQIAYISQWFWSHLRTRSVTYNRAGFCWWGPGANIEDGSSLIIHWSSGSHKRSTMG